MIDVTKIDGIIWRHDTDDYGVWRGISLSQQDEEIIQLILSKYDTQGVSTRGSWKEIVHEMMSEISDFKRIKITEGTTSEFEVIETNAPDSVIKANLSYINACLEDGEKMKDPYVIIKNMGYEVSIVATQDDNLTQFELDRLCIRKEFDLYDF